MSVLLGMTLAMGVVSVGFSADDTTKKETKKKGKKKKTAPPTDTKAPA